MASSKGTPSAREVAAKAGRCEYGDKPVGSGDAGGRGEPSEPDEHVRFGSRPSPPAPTVANIWPVSASTVVSAPAARAVK